MKHIVGSLNKEIWATLPDTLGTVPQHEMLGSIGKLGIMKMMSETLKVGDCLREYIDQNMNSEEATLWLKEIKKQEHVRDHIKKHQPFNLFYNQRTHRNEVPKQPHLLEQIGLFLLCERAMELSKEEEIRKQQAQKNEGQV